MQISEAAAMITSVGIAVLVASKAWRSVLKTIHMTRAQSASPQTSTAARNDLLGFWLKIFILLLSMLGLWWAVMLPDEPLTRRNAAFLAIAQFNCIMALWNLRA